ncbi:MAG: tol-pal system-associated acyl-CoA thioesterase [Pikeienuella sp.]
MIHRLNIRVYYEDTDVAGVVYHANYLKFFERGRTETLRSIGIDQLKLKEQHGLVYVVTRIEVDFRAPARFDDMVAVETEVKERTPVRIEILQRLTRKGQTLAEAKVWIASINEAGQPQRMPDQMSAALDRLVPAR